MFKINDKKLWNTNSINKMSAELGITKIEANEILDRMVMSLPEYIKKIDIAFKNNKFEDITSMSHGLKGLTANLRIDDLSSEFFELEKSSKIMNAKDCNNKIQSIKHILKKMNVTL